MKFYENEIEKVYIINGLARSGNHFFISWLISGLKDEKIYYMNNIKLKQHGIIGDREVNDKKILRNHIICKDNRYGMKIEKELRDKLATEKEMRGFIKKRKKIKTLIFSMENKKTERMDKVSEIFKRAKKKYLIIIIRDILNLFSSRIQSEKLLKNKKTEGWQYETDIETIEWWMENYKGRRGKIIFNYNKFLCYKITRETLAKKLDINIRKTKITLNKFGLTSGSSFKNKKKTEKEEYFMRWKKNENNKIIKYLLKDKEILKILCKDFLMCIDIKRRNMIICNNKKKIRI